MAASDQGYESIVFFEELTKEQRDALLETVWRNPVLTDLFLQWWRWRVSIRESIDTSLPDRSLLVLYALDTDEFRSFLSPGEKGQLQRVLPLLEHVFEVHPFLTDVVEQIRRDARLFGVLWDQHITEGELFDARHPRPDLEPRVNSRRFRSLMRTAWRTAAVFTLVAFAIILFLITQRDNHLLTIRTEGNEVRIIELVDGSTVRLMGESTLSYTDPTKGNVFNRQVKLDGHAFFEVAPGREGFVVTTPSALTTVLGTSFGVRSDERVTEVVLVAGTLSVASKSAPGNLVMLQEGQMSRVATGALPSTPVEVDLDTSLDWTGLFIFRATPIEQIIESLSEHYQVAVRVSDELIGERVSGVFPPELTITDILNTLAATLGATVEQIDTGSYRLLIPSDSV